MEDFELGISACGKYIRFRPNRVSASEEELLRRWALIANLGRRQGIFRVLFDHSAVSPPADVDMIAAALRNPEWREGESWRVALLGSRQARDHTRYTLESTAEFVSAIKHRAAAFLDADEADRWLSRDPE